MAWSMPTTGQWGPGMGVTPDMNMGNYTAEQWTAMQQQSWQHWTQWQQQYASWQSQYGSKYAEQMQAMQAMGSMPPLPPSSSAPPPPAPPPPDKPPPPPHENNQPLYGNAQQPPGPVLAPVQTTAPPNASADTTGNTHNRNQQPDSSLDASVNSEALRTLAEEQKAFDIQFQKWEEEFEKWKKENVNHPDKQAYREYEQKFEACKAQLLERRMQMKQKKAKLLNNTSQIAKNNTFRINVPPGPPPNVAAVPPPVHNTSSNTYIINNEPPSYPPPNYNKNFSQNSQYNNISQYYGRENENKNFEPRDRQESYSSDNASNNINTSNLINTEPFLPTSQPPKGIPGLDLVPEPDKFGNKPQDVIDITDDPMEKQFRNNQPGPDYSKISKGINNILGDETIMNILSLVRGQAPPSNNAPINNTTVNNSSVNNQGSYGPVDSVNNRQNNYMGRNEAYNDNYGTGQSQNMSNDYNMHQETNQANKYSAPPPQIYQQRSDMQQNQYNARNQQPYKGQGLLPRPGSQQNVRPNAPMRSLLDPIQPQTDYARGGFDTRGMEEEIPPQPNVGMRPNPPARPSPPVRPTWPVDPLFAPSIIVEYEHKPLRLKARDFIEPVHTFHYNHKSKDSDVKKKDFEKEADELFTRHPRGADREDRYSDRPSRDLYYRNNDRIGSKDGREFRDDLHSRGFREDFDDRRRFEDDRRRFDDNLKDHRFEDRRRDDRDKYYRRDDLHRDRDREEVFRERERDLERIRARERERDLERSRERDRDRGSDYNRERDAHRDRNRDIRKSRSRERDSRKRAHSRDSELSSSSSKKAKDPQSNNANGKPKHTVMIDDLLEMPGRQMRPEKIVIILRGPPGSGKSYLAKLIRDREAEQGGTVRVMSIDDYFMQEGEIEEKDPATGKIVKKPSLQYEYDEKQEEAYLASLKRAFKRSLTDGYFTFLIYDAVNDQLRSYADIWNFARQTGFQVYICTMELDPQTCFKRNIHNRRLEEIEVICSRFFPTPAHHIQLDPTTLLQSASIPDVHMEDADDDVTMEDAQDTEVDSSFTSKWEKMEDAEQLARLDGTSRPLRHQPSMEDYLQLDDWTPAAAKPGKKTVRWADIEERRQQEKMRAIGFVVGQTDWNRMTDPTMGSGALTQTKYIERVRR